MSTTVEPDTYKSWMERVMGGAETKPLEAGEEVKSSSGEPFDVIQFARTERVKYVGEIGKKMGDYVYHFFPVPNTRFPDNFEEKMGDAFLQVFQFEERVEAVFSPELNSWAVRAKGFAINPLSDDLALGLFKALDQKLE